MPVKRRLLLWAEKHVLTRLRPLLSNRVYTIRRGLGKGLKRKGGMAFIPEGLSGASREERFLSNLVGELGLNGKVVYDLGGYQGVFTLFFARAVGAAGRVITYEPNPANYKNLVENVRLNHFENVEVYQMGVGKAPGTFELAFNDRDPGRSSFREGYLAERSIEETNRIQVEIDTVDNQRKSRKLPRPDLVKIDVEELELDVLKGMKETIEEHKPPLFVELHGGYENVRDVVQLLHEHEYSVHHLEGDAIVGDPVPRELEGGHHIYCT